MGCEAVLLGCEAVLLAALPLRWHWRLSARRLSGPRSSKLLLPLLQARQLVAYCQGLLTAVGDGSIHRVLRSLM